MIVHNETYNIKLITHYNISRLTFNKTLQSSCSVVNVLQFTGHNQLLDFA